MRALIQRVSEGGVSIGGERHSGIGPGLLIFLGVSVRDDAESARSLAERCARLRIFQDESGKMNLSLADTGREALVVSQFTLYADTRKGNRPGFADAAAPAEAEALYEAFVAHLRGHLGPEKVSTGIFRARMEVRLVNDGPVTLMLESKDHLP